MDIIKIAQKAESEFTGAFKHLNNETYKFYLVASEGPLCSNYRYDVVVVVQGMVRVFRFGLTSENKAVLDSSFYDSDVLVSNKEIIEEAGRILNAGIAEMVNESSSMEVKGVESKIQLTLGELIEWLRKVPPYMEIMGLGDLHSYRGYYCELAFIPTKEPERADSLIKRCLEAIGKSYTGYKGGGYIMATHTSLFVADYGHCGRRLVGIRKDGTIKTKKDY